MERKDSRSVARGRSHLLVNKGGEDQESERGEETERERERVRELLPSGINTERWSRVQ